jgi:beta-lactamase class D
MRQLIIFFTFVASAFAIEPNFGKYDGTGVVYDMNISKRTIFNESRANERLNPCSTFKILNSIIALDTAVVKDENETIKWDGMVREYPTWNKDHNMRSAISVSAVWFYQELAHRIGAGMMQVGVVAADYGNMDSSRTLTDFWLDGGSLKISANEQIDFLSKMLTGKLPFSALSVNTTKEIMVLEQKDDYVFGGKTGSCGGIGWFVGFVENGGRTKIFAFNIKGNGANGAEAKRIATEYLKATK